MPKASIFPIKPEDLDKVWGVLSPFIEESMSYGLKTHDLSDIYTGIMAKTLSLWAILGANDKLCGAAITCVEVYPKMKIACLRWIGGNDINEWLEISLKVLAGWARQNGCDFVRSYGRKGWERKLQPYGWEKVGSLVLLDVKNKTIH